MATDLTPGELPEAVSKEGSAPVWLVVAFAFSFLGLVAMAAWVLAPAGGCGGG